MSGSGGQASTSLSQTFEARFREEDAITPDNEIPRAFRVRFACRSFKPLNPQNTPLTTQWKHTMDAIHHGKGACKSMKMCIDWLQIEYKNAAKTVIEALRTKKALAPSVDALRRGVQTPAQAQPQAEAPASASERSPIDMLTYLVRSPISDELPIGVLDHIEAALEILQPEQAVDGGETPIGETWMGDGPLDGRTPATPSGPGDQGLEVETVNGSDDDDSIYGLHIDDLSIGDGEPIDSDVIQGGKTQTSSDGIRDVSDIEWKRRRLSGKQRDPSLSQNQQEAPRVEGA